MHAEDAGRLLAEILADPANEAARLVYADHLMELGDPRGELVQLQCRFEKIAWDDPERRRLDERIADLLATHESEWTREVRALGFDDHLQQVSMRRGFVEKVRLDARDAAQRIPALRALTPLREVHVSGTDGAHLDDAGAALCELEAISFRGFPRELSHAVAQRLPRWPHQGKLRTLHVSGSEAARAIAATPALRGLEVLRVTSIEPQGIAQLAMAPHVATVHTLELPQSGIGPDGLDALARSAYFSALRRVQLEHARLTGAAIETFARSAIAPALRQLRVHHNKLGDRGATALATGFPALDLLDVEATELRGDGAVDLFASARLPKLVSLDISRNALGDAPLARAVDALALPALRHLACIENNVESAAALAFARSPRLADLRSLDLSNNPLGDAGVIALVDGAQLPALEVLRIKSTGVGQRGLRALGTSEVGARLRALDVARNEVDDHGLAALLDGDHLAALDALDLGGCALSIRGIRALVASPLAARLKHLTLTGLDVGALDPLLSADLPELRSLVADRFDDDAAYILAAARGLPSLHSIVFAARELTDAGAHALADSAALRRILWLELDAPGVTDIGRSLLRRRFGHHVAVFAGGSLHAFSALGRRV